MKRRNEEAKQILAALVGRDVFPEDESIVQTYTNICRGVNSTTYFVASFVPIWLIDRYGQKSLLLFSAVGMACMMVMLTASLSVGLGNFTAGVFAILSIFLF